MAILPVSALGGEPRTVLDQRLVSAIIRDDPVAAESLLERGANPNQMTACGQTNEGEPLLGPLLTCAITLRSFGDPDIAPHSKDLYRNIIKSLLAHGARVTLVDQNGTTPLMMASFWDDTSTIALLLRRKSAVNAMDRMGRTALMYACAAESELYGGTTCQYSAANILLHAGGDVRVRDHDGNTILHILTLVNTENGRDSKDKAEVDRNVVVLARYVVAHGVAPDARNRFGLTALAALDAGSLSDHLPASPPKRGLYAWFLSQQVRRGAR